MQGGVFVGLLPSETSPLLPVVRHLLRGVAAP
jgi:hypothetical protein